MAQLHLKQFILGASGALLLSGSALAVTQAPQSQPTAAQSQSQEQPVPNEAKQQDISALEKQADAFTEAWNQKDSKTLSSLFSSKAALLVPSGKSAVGRQEIEKAFTEELGQPQLEDARMVTRIQTVRQLTPNLFLVDTTHSITGPKVQQHQGQPMEVHAVIVAEKRGNTWRFREARAIPELNMEQQTGVGGSGEPAEQEATEPGTGGSADAPEHEPLEPDTGGSGEVTPPINEDTGGSGIETETGEAPQPDTGIDRVPEDGATEPTY